MTVVAAAANKVNKSESCIMNRYSKFEVLSFEFEFVMFGLRKLRDGLSKSNWKSEALNM